MNEARFEKFLEIWEKNDAKKKAGKGQKFNRFRHRRATQGRK